MNKRSISKNIGLHNTMITRQMGTQKICILIAIVCLTTFLTACIPAPPKATFYPKTCALKMLTEGWLFRKINAYNGREIPIWPPKHPDATRTFNLCDQPIWQAIYDSSQTISLECWISERADDQPDKWGKLHLEIFAEYWSRDSIALEPVGWGI